MKKLQVTLAILMLLLGVISFNIKNAYAWYNTPVQTEVYATWGTPVAKVGSTTKYGYIGPAAERNPQFYSALISGGTENVFGHFGAYWAEVIRIEVSGVYPNGDTMPGNRFGDRTVLVSPDDSGVERQILRIIFDTLFYESPSGLKAIVKNTVSEGGAITDYDAEKAWAEWYRPFLDSPYWHLEKGLEFGYELNVDPALEGTYTINIHYLAEIWATDSVTCWYEYTINLYDTVTYEYVNTPPAPFKPDGRESGYTYTTYTYSTITTDPNGDSLRYQFDWDDDSTTTTGWYTSGATASASHYWTSSGTYDVKVRAQDSTGAWSDWSSSLAVTISDRIPGGCPILSVYDGTEYVLEGLLDIHNPDGIDEITSHVLIHTPEPVEHRYLLRLTEHPQTYSHLDQVRLFAMLTNGTEVKLPLVSAIHSEDGNVKQELLVSDDVRAVMLGENWNNGTSQYIDLKFVAPEELDIETFTFIIEGHNRPLKIP